MFPTSDYERYKGTFTLSNGDGVFKENAYVKLGDYKFVFDMDNPSCCERPGFLIDGKKAKPGDSVEVDGATQFTLNYQMNHDIPLMQVVLNNNHSFSFYNDHNGYYPTFLSIYNKDVREFTTGL